MKVKNKNLNLQVIEDTWKDCVKCEIGKQCKQKVFLDTIPTMIEQVDILFIGEGPGQVEDVKGLPFVGKAGQLFRNAIRLAGGNDSCKDCKGVVDERYYKINTSAIRCERCSGSGYEHTIGFTNLVACRPYARTSQGPGNRAPTQIEVASCLPRLIQTIRVLNPSIIVYTGNEAYDWHGPIEDMLKIWNMEFKFRRIAHPSYYERTGGEDTQNFGLYVQAIRKILNESKVS